MIINKRKNKMKTINPPQVLAFSSRVLLATNTQPSVGGPALIGFVIQKGEGVQIDWHSNLVSRTCQIFM